MTIANPASLRVAIGAAFFALLAGSTCFLCAQEPKNTNPREQVDFILAGMRQERLKIRSGQCRVKIRYVEKNRPDQTDIDVEKSVFTAFDGPMRRFDFRELGWIPDQANVKENPKDPNNPIIGMKRGIVNCKFFDSGKKAGFWLDYNAYIELSASLGDLPPSLHVQYFDVRGFGLYGVGLLSAQTALKPLLDSFLDIKTTDIMVDREQKDVWTVRWRYKMGKATDVDVLLSVDVRNGFTPVRYLNRVWNREHAEGDAITLEENKTTWERRKDVWVPLRYSYQLGSGLGKSHLREVTYDIKWEKINEDIDKDLFDYPSFGAPDSVGVVDGSLGKGVTVKAAAAPPQPQPTNWWMRAIGIACAVLLCAAVMRRFWLHRKGRPSQGSTVGKS